MRQRAWGEEFYADPQRSLSFVLRLFGCVWLVACGDHHAWKSQGSVVGFCKAKLRSFGKRAHRARLQKQDVFALERLYVAHPNRVMKLL